MILASLVIGLVAAYYLGLKIGAAAAAAAFGLFFLAVVVPGAAAAVYGLVAVGLVALLIVGPRVAPSPEANKVRRVLNTLWSQARRTLRRRS